MNASHTPSRAEAWTFAAVLVCMFLAALDQTIVSTAMPRIVLDLHGLVRYSWVTTAYLLTSTALVPIYGKLADVRQHFVVQAGAIGIFLMGSILCGLAGIAGTLPLLGDGMDQLILARAIQGIGGSGLFAMAFIVIADLFPPAVRARYQGWIGSVWGLASLVGPLLGGLLTDRAGAWIPGIAGWRWVFLVNVPVGSLALWILFTRMPRKAAAHPGGHVDLGQAALLMAGLVPLLLALSLGGHWKPWTDPVIFGLFIAGLALLAIFVVVVLQSRTPLLQLRLYKERTFQAMNWILILHGAAFMGMVIFSPLYLVNARGFSPAQAGMSLIPMTIGVMIGSMMAGQIASRRRRVKFVFLYACPAMVLAFFALAMVSDSMPSWLFILELAIAGVVVSPTFVLGSLAVQNAVEPRVIGQATALAQFTRQIGGAVGSAALGAIFAVHVSQGHGHLSPEEYAHVLSEIFWVSGILSALSMLGAWFLPDLELKGRAQPAGKHA